MNNLTLNAVGTLTTQNGRPALLAKQALLPVLEGGRASAIFKFFGGLTPAIRRNDGAASVKAHLI